MAGLLGRARQWIGAPDPSLPRLGRRAAWRRSLLVALILLPEIVVAGIGGAHGIAVHEVADYWRFAPAGRALLAGEWSQVYSDPSVQGGPLELLIYGLIDLIPVGAAGWAVIHTVVIAATVVVVGRCLLSAVPMNASRRHLLLLAVVLALGVALGPLAIGVSRGHPAQLGITVMWIVAAVFTRRGRALVGAAILGASALWEPWGVLAVPVLLLAPRLSVARLAAAAAIAVGVAALVYLPFVLSGTFELGRFTWPWLDARTLLGGFFGISEIGWSYRLVQSAAAVAVGSAVALLSRRATGVEWIVPIAVVASRLFLDTLANYYYAVPPLVLLLTASLAFAVAHRWRMLVVVAAFIALFGVFPGVHWITTGLLLVAAVTFAIAEWRRASSVPTVVRSPTRVEA